MRRSGIHCFSVTRVFLLSLLAGLFLLRPSAGNAQIDFNPTFIISDPEMLDYQSWTRNDVQSFLQSKGGYLRNLQTNDASGTLMRASDIIYNASQRYQINPKFLVVTLQKEQSLITDDSPTQKQLDWAAGFGVCDGCDPSSPALAKYKGFGKQVDDAAGIMRWYYDNKDANPAVKKKDTPIRIDNQDITPQSWATAFLYTYTPHRHGNLNFWNIWSAWFSQIYPNGTLLKTSLNGDIWLIQDGARRQFKNQTALITRADPALAIVVPEAELENYQLGPVISFPNYSLLRTATTTYLLDYDTLRPFASAATVADIGYNPDEIIDVNPSDLNGLKYGSVITDDAIAPEGIIYDVADLPEPPAGGHAYYFLKDNVLYPLVDRQVVAANFKNLPKEKHPAKDLAKFTLADRLITFADGTLLQTKDDSVMYVIDGGKKRRLADAATFQALGYKRSNVLTVPLTALLNIPEGDRLFVNASLLSNKNKFLGDSNAPVADNFKSSLPAYLVAEYPSGRILSGKDIDTPRPIASLTKLLTGYEALRQSFKLNKKTVYDDGGQASSQNPIGFKNGDVIKNADLLNVMLAASTNSLSRLVALGAGLSEPEFVKAVNVRLEDWGADNTIITDTTGLDAGNVSTPRDLLKIFRNVLEDKTMAAGLGHSTYNFTRLAAAARPGGKKRKAITHLVRNTNQLFFSPHRRYRILASKTGYTAEAGATMVMLVQSTPTKKQYIIVTMANGNYPRRFEEPGKIADWISTADPRQLAAQ